ncbi:transporter [Streptomyces noursei]|uniref:Transporter n=1 Tax=Streptomyces noursei TaxID=1971 RepID=A0A401RCS5_STRNR|nr:transporter [Streptomyces noursei PD-1]GCB95409.1 transporter [Streptomyces noursei]
MDTMLGVTFLASEYVIGCDGGGGRIDSLGIDENGAPVVVEYKRGTDSGVINQGLYYLSWLLAHRDAFRALVRERLGATVASQVLWSAPRLICFAGDFTRYDAHAVREHRRSIDLVRYRYYGDDHFGLETAASVTGLSGTAKRSCRRESGQRGVRPPGGALAELAEAVDEVLLGVGDGVTRVQRKQYVAHQRLCNFACVIPPQQTKLLIYLKANPKKVDLIPGLTRNVTKVGHHGTGNLLMACGCRGASVVRGVVAGGRWCSRPAQSPPRRRSLAVTRKAPGERSRIGPSIWPPSRWSA